MVQPTTTGTLRAAVNADYDAMVYARTICNDPTTDLRDSCDDLAVLDFPVTAGETYYLVVDGVNGASGTATLSLVIEP